MTLAPILLFTYNRPVHTRLTVESLQKNALANDSELVIFSDAPKKAEDEASVQQVRNYLRTVDKFKSVTIIEREQNYGLANNIIDGVTGMLAKNERVIVLEDDLLTSPYFLKYMNEALEMYQFDEQVLSIHAYNYPVKQQVPTTFFLIDPGSLGWGTWSNRWKDYEKDGAKLYKELQEKGLTAAMNYDNTYPFTTILEYQIAGKNSSWVIRWYAYALIHSKLTLYPGKSLVFHMGNDGTGTHEGSSSHLDVEISNEPVDLKRIEPVVNIQARDAFKDYFRSVKGNLIRRGIRKIKKFISNAGS